ncbi:MAG: antibiotic biosynthesis monooxygenase [Marinicaulis sp.]|nr:antibiotic biosynthesis monooxygenase [Marinicaulis sp.]NNE41544.1 antibiotic biosynthesis monooxygenase [Marinicaulis sp.]NNL87880.1 antibiotic biosynthesis monooxygenase [Marinicaulis sp.]
MTVSRINKFTAQAGKGDALVAALREVLPAMKAADGFLSYTILQGTPDTDAVAVIEVWDSIEAHKAAAALIPPQDFQKIMPLLASPPAGDYYKSR